METADYTDDESDSSLPKQKWWADQYLYQINGFWLIPEFVPGIRRVLNHYNPSPTDVILASFPKTGTTWLKSLLYSISNRSSKEALVMNHPHELVPTLEVQVYTSQESSFPSPVSHDHLHTTTRIFSTHIPHQLISETLNSSDCRVVYVTRNPKDTLVSMWHFVNKWKMAEQEPWPIEVAIEKFCSGIFPCGPYYDHVMGYKKESLVRPNKVFFITYEELKDDPKTHVKELAEFLGCPFEGDHKELELDEVVRSCSFDVLSNYKVNKSENFPTWFEVPYNSFFRQGAVGDHRNYLSVETIERIDALTREKFHGSGFTYGI